MSYYFTFKKCFEEPDTFTKFFPLVRDFLKQDGFHFREIPLDSDFHIAITKRVYACQNEADLNYLLTAYGNIVQRVPDDENFKYKLSYIDSIRQ